jgi:hypothetical protein
MHINAGGGTGTETIYASNANINVKMLANVIAQNVSNGFDIPLRRVYFRVAEGGTYNYYALHREGSINTIILEPLFIDSSDVNIIKSEGFYEKYTDLVLSAVVRIYDLHKKAVKKLDWKESLSKRTIEGERWIRGFNSLVEMANQNGDLGDLEIFKSLPTLIEKYEMLIPK